MEIKNPRYNLDGSIDCEINHPVYGWIPFTATTNDSEQQGRDIYASAVAGDFGAVDEYVAPPANNDARIEEINIRLSEIDAESIRALRAKTVGRGAPSDDAKLTALEDEAELLRAELAGL